MGSDFGNGGTGLQQPEGLSRLRRRGGVRVVDESTLVPDELLSIDQGAVASCQALMWSLMKDIAREMGVRTDASFCQLTAEERDIIFHGFAIKKEHHLSEQGQRCGGRYRLYLFQRHIHGGECLSTVKDEKGMKQVEEFLKQGMCPDCSGTRPLAAVRTPRLRGSSLDEVYKMPLAELVNWVTGVPGSLSEEMWSMAESICQSFQTVSKRLMNLGLGYRPWSGRHPPCPPESVSGCSWPGRCATAPPEYSTCWTSLPSVCTSPILWGSPE